MPVSPADEWRADVVVSRAEAQRLVGCPVEPFAEGWDKTVFRAGEQLVAFCRRGIAVDGMRRELAVLPLLADDLPVRLPVPLAQGTFGDHEWPWWTMPLLPGEELLRHTGEDRDALGRDVGAFLRTLHVLTPPLDLPVDPMARSDAGRRGHLAQERLARLGLEPPAILRSGLGPSPHRPVLCHGDLHARHVLVDGGRCGGVIDWEDICMADPAVDLSIAYAGFEGSARKALFAEYGAVDEERETRARVLAIFLSSALAETAAAAGDETALAGALAGIHRASN